MDEKIVDLEQLEKRVAWLDSERRNDKTVIAALQSKIETLDTENNALRTRLADMDSEITRLNTLMARLEQFELDINEVRNDTSKQLDDFKENIREKSLQSEKQSQEIGGISQNLTDIRKKLQNLDEVENAIRIREEEDIRLARLIEELKAQVSEVEHFDEDYKRTLRLLEENRRQDAKRLTDLQGELAATRKRQDETRGKQDLVGDNLRKMDNRIKDLLEAESERREAQTAFIEKVNLAQVERDRTFKQWQESFDEMDRITSGLENELADLENTHRSVKQSQDALDEVTQRFDRRINEITEIQRLNEDRFRQEWTTFKSDDQKRWSNYILSQEEQHREMNRSLESLDNRIATLEDHLTDLQDNIEQLGKDDIKRMTELMNSLRNSIETYNNIYKE
jgi:chromosome segregation ATPase